jgi:predicted DsbA family dithiol-disulfide isomerase
MTSRNPLEVVYFSDLLCVWAYAGQVRVDELRAQMGDEICVADRFLNVYGDVPSRIQKHAGDASDPAATYAKRMRAVASRFEHTKMSERCFTDVCPPSSNQAHLVLSAVRTMIADGDLEGDDTFPPLIRRVRLAFFEEALDVGRLDVLYGLLEASGIPRGPVEERLANGTAMAALSADLLEKDNLAITGSPTWVLDGGRQKLFGNVGYRVVQANIHELLRGDDRRSGASWC